MAAKMVKCVKLGTELPGIDPDTPEGRQALKFALLIGGAKLMVRIRDEVSQRAWDMWKDHSIMIFNEYRLDPMSDRANEVLRPYMEAFFFGEQKEIPNYVPPAH